MRQFAFLDDDERARLFHAEPADVDPEGPLDQLAHALGATLYIPATRPDLAADVVRVRGLGAGSVVLCLEDAIPDGAVGEALENVEGALAVLAGKQDLPLVFVRVRDADQVGLVTAMAAAHPRVLDGFVLPKFGVGCGPGYLDAVAAGEQRLGRRLLAMPVVETARVVHAETRVAELVAIRELLAGHRDRVLAVRIGATDMGSAFALRRPPDLTVYDVRLVAAAIGDVVNVLGRPEVGHAVSGPVWEYFTSADRVLRPQLRATPFASREDQRLRAELMARDLDGLIREVLLDRANGLLGKTVIHPSHVPVVHAMSVVSHEEWADATEVLAAADSGGGVVRSAYGNKMNEGTPHAAWARRLLLRASVFGVARPDVTFVDLLSAAIGPDA
ncbi:HpcH/HpaI aldolase/citrate lyase family protein [uncultured Nocardioides sp.]|uniref:HpcH/HpaI aldolase/citrate lyase family protein n=1 Tax=uncultured Nocardioides sp. TaxID=198441 RepID=UPI00262CED55|nr:HpcH/HpaI aldolase/citrate lyase family protein [uncultured Nocardioides sp.]